MQDSTPTPHEAWYREETAKTNPSDFMALHALDIARQLAVGIGNNQHPENANLLLEGWDAAVYDLPNTSGSIIGVAISLVLEHWTHGVELAAQLQARQLEKEKRLQAQRRQDYINDNLPFPAHLIPEYEAVMGCRP